MDEEEKYWTNLERIYVHNVYENISSRYDEFFRSSKLKQCYKEKENEEDQQYSNKTTNENSKTDLSQTKCSILKQTSNNYLRKEITRNNSSKSIELKRTNSSNGYHKYKAWPKVKNFILKLEPYSMVADVGCGEGKYLNINNKIISIGSDRSESLCKLSLDKQSENDSIIIPNQILICDNLALPFKSDLFDAVISIGVIHHFSTPKRRIKAINELCRILRSGGKLMIYVWALEQRVRKFISQDVLVPLVNTGGSNEKNNSQVKIRLRRDLSNNSNANSDDSNDETNPTLFKSNDDSMQKQLLKQISFVKQTVDVSYQPQNKNLNDTITSSSNSSIKNETECRDKSEKLIDQSLSKNLSDSSSLNHDVLMEQNQNENSLSLVDNLKLFFTKKFSSNKTNPLNIKTDETSNIQKDLNPLLNQTITSVSFKTNQENILQSKLKLEELNTMKRYQQIIEEHKDILPKNFTIRQFPYSSCLNTFDTNNPKKDTNENSNIETSDSSSPLNLNEANKDSEKILNESSKQASNQTKTESNEFSIYDSSNILNKRFYHVFKRNELENLIKENFFNLEIYDSYYDHGNWCICAIKK